MGCVSGSLPSPSYDRQSILGSVASPVGYTVNLHSQCKRGRSDQPGCWSCMGHRGADGTHAKHQKPVITSQLRKEMKGGRVPSAHQRFRHCGMNV
eukprot:5745509-Amphidinium_carterae.1